MSTLRQAAGDYIMVRRALGSKLERHPGLLESFIAYMEAAGATTVTTELALAWARLPGDDAHPAYLSNRLCAVRGFARHLQAFDPATEVPAAGLLAWPKCRAVPYLYSGAGVTALMGAARSLAPALRAASYQTLIGLLAATGMRVGEAIRLNRDDADWEEGVLTIKGLQVQEEPRGAAAPEHTGRAASLHGPARRAVPPAGGGEPARVPGGHPAGLQHRPGHVLPPGPRRRAEAALGAVPAPHPQPAPFVCLSGPAGLVPGRSRRGGPPAAAVNVSVTRQPVRHLLVLLRFSDYSDARSFLRVRGPGPGMTRSGDFRLPG